MKTKAAAPAGKARTAPRPKRETVADWLRSIESTLQPRPDTDFAAMLMAGRARGIDCFAHTSFFFFAALYPSAPDERRNPHPHPPRRHRHRVD